MHDLRIIYSDNGTLSDYSRVLNKFNAETQAFSYVTGQDAIYIGSAYPFSRKFFELSAVNVSAAVPTIAYWDGVAWRSVVDIQDDTDVSGATLGRSGQLLWTTDKNYLWNEEDTVTPQGTEHITDLGDVTIYERYWLKITFNASFSFTLQWVGELFLDSDDLLQVHYPDLTSTFAGDFETSKTNFFEQRVLATQLVIAELMAGGHIKAPELLKDLRFLEVATAHKTAEIIYSSSGPSYVDREARAAEKFETLLNKNLISADKDFDGREDREELAGMKVTRLSR